MVPCYFEDKKEIIWKDEHVTDKADTFHLYDIITK